MMPSSLPFVSLGLIYSLPLDLVIQKLPLVTTSVHILHPALPRFLSTLELSNINHAIRYLLPPLPVGFRQVPTARVAKQLAHKVLAVLSQRTLPLKLTLLALPLINRTVRKY